MKKTADGVGEEVEVLRLLNLSEEEKAREDAAHHLEAEQEQQRDAHKAGEKEMFEQLRRYRVLPGVYANEEERWRTLDRIFAALALTQAQAQAQRQDQVAHSFVRGTQRECM